jgi:hypothetical protein
LTGEVGLEGGGEVIEAVTASPTRRFNLGSSPSTSRVVHNVQSGSQRLLMVVRFPAHADQLRVAAKYAVRRQGIDLVAVDLAANRLYEGLGFLPDIDFSGADLAWPYLLSQRLVFLPPDIECDLVPAGAGVADP